MSSERIDRWTRRRGLPDYDWEALERVAKAEVEACLASMPPEVQDIAIKVPCLIRKWHPDALAGDPEFRDWMGEYMSFEENQLGESNGPIALYLGAIHEFCRSEGLSFASEVRQTYLHELGHHFGWDEDDIELRGLE